MPATRTETKEGSEREILSRKLKMKAALLVSLLMVINAAFGQNAQTVTPRGPLTQQGPPRQTHELAKNVLGPVRCDAAGNIYFRIAGESRDYQEPIVRVSANGQESLRFDARTAKTLPATFMHSAFAVDSQGKVFEMAFDPDFNLYLIRYSATGLVESSTRLNDVFSPVAMSVLESGQLLVLASVPQIGNESNVKTFRIFLLGQDGTVKPSQRSIEGSPAVRAEASDDGRVYIMDGDVLAIYDQEARRLRTLSIKSGIVGAKMVDWVVGRNRLIVEFRKESDERDPGFIKIWDLSSARAVAEYGLSESVQGTVVCDSGQQLTFLVVDQSGHSALLGATVP